MKLSIPNILPSSLFVFYRSPKSRPKARPNQTHPDISDTCREETIAKLPDHDYDAAQQSAESQLQAAQKRIEELEAMVDQQRRPERHFLERFSSNPDKIRFYTGFPSYSLLMAFFNFVLPHAVNMITWNQVQRNNRGEASTMRTGFQCSLPMIDQFFLFMNKLKLGSFDVDLGDKFGVSASTVSRITTTWANFLYVILGSIPLWPSRKLVDDNMPQIFEQYPKTRVILDCTELFVQAPSSLNLNSELYSHYKGHDTFKCLVGISPGGLVTFVSNLYAGGISDKDITTRSGILDLLEPGDQVMVDKGFTIEDLLTPLGCSLVIPPFLTAHRNQFSKEETEQTQTIARLRVHVERAIRRVKEYHLFDGTLPISLAGSVNQLWTVCCILTNFQGPLF